MSGGEAGTSAPDGVVYYDKRWRPCGETEAAYALRLAAPRPESAALPLLCELSVEKITGEKIIGFTASATRRAMK